MTSLGRAASLALAPGHGFFMTRVAQLALVEGDERHS